MKRLTLALTAAALSQMALAIENPFIGIDYQQGTFKLQGQKANPQALRITGGSELNPYLAVVAQAGIKTQTDSFTLQGPVTFETSIKSFYALFIRPQISLGQIASVYALAGGSYLNATADSSDPSIQKSVTGFSHQTAFGGGADFKIYDKFRLNADYIKYSKNYSAISLGVRYSFY